MIWDEHTYLMVDWAFAAEESNTSMVREEAFKHGDSPLIRLQNKALTLGGRASSLVINLITRESGTYRLWYQIRGLRRDRPHIKDALCGYAESADGIHFKPVRLGQVEFEGSRNNNLVDLSVPGQPGVRHCGFMRDPLDKEYPYKCAYQRPASGGDLQAGIRTRWPALAEKDWHFVWGISRSRDGLVWEAPTHSHDMVQTNPENPRLHRAMDGAIVLSDQMMCPIAEIGGRNVKGWLTEDGVHAERIPDFLFSLPEHMSRVHGTDYGPTPWDGSKWVQPHVGLVCARKGPTMIGLHGYLYGCAGAETFAQVADIGLAISATGLGFREVWPMRPFIRRGMRGAWDFGMTAQCPDIIDDGDQTRFYYCGGDVGNFASTYLPGLATIPRDRYGYRMIRGYRNVRKHPSTGTFSLKPARLPAEPKIALNVSHISGGGTVRVELADETGKALRGYSFRSCLPVTGNGLRRRVRWKHGRSAAELGGRTVTIRVRMNHPSCGVVHDDSPRVYAVYMA